MNPSSLIPTGDYYMALLSHNQVLDQILLPLADVFEAGNTKRVTLTPSSSEEYEPLRECLAALTAEGSLGDPENAKVYRLTPLGYAKYKDRINALRTLPH
jgi:hypothetical protein